MPKIAKPQKRKALGRMERIAPDHPRWSRQIKAPAGITHAYTDWNVIALVSEIETPEYGVVTHLWIRDVASSTHWPWYLLQEIKNQICGSDRMAIEIFPTDESLVDGANMRHLWVFPAGFRFPFGLGQKETP